MRRSELKMREMCVKNQVHVTWRGVNCAICNKKIMSNEVYFKTGKTRKKTRFGLVKGLGVRNYCAGCVDSVYVDGDEKRQAETSLKKLGEVTVYG
jgi:hypothetical protein